MHRGGATDRLYSAVRAAQEETARNTVRADLGSGPVAHGAGDTHHTLTLTFLPAA